MTKDLKIVADYCAENILGWEERVQIALMIIDRWRCSLEQADSALYNDIVDAIDECAEDYEIDAENIDIEDVIWA